MLTLKALKEMPSNEIFATGVVNDPRLHEKPVRWIAKRGYMYDWAIYYNLPEKNIEEISEASPKSFTPEVIKELVPCDKEAFAMYRF